LYDSARNFGSPGRLLAGGLSPRKALVQGDLVGAADREGDALVERSRHDVEDGPAAGRRAGAGVLGDESQRVTLVEDAQLAGFPVRGRGIEIDAALEQDPMEVRHERAGVAGRVGSPRRPVARLQVL